MAVVAIVDVLFFAGTVPTEWLKPKNLDI